MTSSRTRFLVAADFGTTATRENGAIARARVLAALESHTDVVLDFCNAGFLTPSFVDELVGRLAAALGETAFRSRVELRNVDVSIRPLIRQVLMGRLRGPGTSANRDAVCHA